MKIYKIYIDVSVLTLATFVTGIQRVAREVAVRFIEKGGDEIWLLHYNAAKNVYRRIDNRLFCDYYLQGRGIKNKMITRREVPLEEIGEGCLFFDLDAAWMSRVKRSYLLPILKSQGAKIVAHIYDIISITHPQYCLQRGVYNFMDYLGAHLLYADKIIANASATIAELDKLAEELDIPLPPCQVIPLGADFGRRTVVPREDVSEELRSAAEDKPYILMVGTIEPRKNHKLLLRAYDVGLREMGYNIVMAGYMGWNMERFEAELKSHPDYGSRIFHFDGLNDRGISWLYQNAKFLAFCSYVEGFGLPLIEAVTRGVPVIAADISVSREVAGDYCIWFEQDNAEMLCERVREYTENQEAYGRLKESLSTYRGAGWEEVCGKMWEAVT